ncbi:hypothetical protein Z043_105416 [Scleropages formosus]|uniref:Ig-like domain-containing protein n=1 Tax=Scleropages formosus TaxID=113540 RepID=A0A0P7XGM1_SCLFO|nr:hypothetical protein Z043_105416 [Scleropages formosus]
MEEEDASSRECSLQDTHGDAVGLPCACSPPYAPCCRVRHRVATTKIGRRIDEPYTEVLQVSGIKVLTAGEVEAVNGTDAWLKCTFETSEPVSELSVTVSWTFRPLGQGKEESVFYYHQKPYPISEGRFRKRVDWSGNIMAKDASITIRDVKFSYNGTFICQVKNLPDVHGLAGEVRLKVVASASYSEISILAAAIGGGILLMLIILLIVVVVKHRRKKREEVAELEFQQRARKDPTMW